MTAVESTCRVGRMSLVVMTKIKKGLQEAAKKLGKNSPRVVSLDYKVTEDSDGNEYLRVWVILHDSDARPIPAWRALAYIEQIIEQEVKKKSKDLWVSCSFRSDKEQRSELRRKDLFAPPERVKVVGVD